MRSFLVNIFTLHHPVNAPVYMIYLFEYIYSATPCECPTDTTNKISFVECIYSAPSSECPSLYNLPFWIYLLRNPLWTPHRYDEPLLNVFTPHHPMNALVYTIYLFEYIYSATPCERPTGTTNKISFVECVYSAPSYECPSLYDIPSWIYLLRTLLWTPQ